jgi:hypothetical protein
MNDLAVRFMSLVGHSRQFSRDWAVSGYRAIPEALRAALQASAQALFKAAETGVSKSMRDEFADHERAAIRPILPSKVLRYVLR